MIVANIGVVLFCFVAAMEGLSGQSADEILERVRQKYDRMTDARISFTQHTSLRVVGIEQTIDGVLQFKKTNQYRIEIPVRPL